MNAAALSRRARRNPARQSCNLHVHSLRPCALHISVAAEAKFPPATAKDFAIIHRTPMTARSTLVSLMSMVLAFRRVCGMPVEYRRRKEL